MRSPGSYIAVGLFFVIVGCGPSLMTLFEQSATPAEAWVSRSGTWTISDSLITATTNIYDDLLAHRKFIPPGVPLTMEVALQGERAGLFFSLDDTLSKRSSHMVRFDGMSILAGYFNGGGEFTATSVFASPFSPRDWVRLRVEIEPVRRSYAVFVNDALLGIDTTLLFRSGYAGLQASAGTSSFREFTVSANGPMPERPAPQAGDVPKLAHIRHLESHGSVPCAYDPASRLWLMLDSNGKVMRTHPAPLPPTLSAQRAELHDRTFTIEGRTLYVWSAEGTLVDSSFGRLGSPEALVAGAYSVFVADSRVNAVLEFDVDGRFVQYHDASPIGGFLAPRGLALLESGEIAVADYDKIAILDPERPGVDLDISFPDPHRAAIERSDGFPIDTFFLSGTRAEVTLEPSGVFTLSDLRPNTTYRFRYGPVLQTIPPSSGISREVAFTTPATDKGQRQYRRLGLLYIIYRTISYRDVYSAQSYPHIPSGRTLSDDEIAYLYDAAAFNREFFFRNSACRLLLDFDIHVVEDTLWLSEVGMSDPYWLEPNIRVTSDVRAAAQRFGKDPSEYDGTICTYAWVNHPPRRTSALRDGSISSADTVRIRQAYGGGTYGVPAPWAFGTTSGYTGNPFQDTFSRQDWLITHEFHHQLDALMHASGFPEYHHCDQPWTMRGAFGEDFNFNAAILRAAEPGDWLALSYGELRTFVDLDQDGLPDDDTSLPFDERRVGSDPEVWDTDGDDLSDLEEMLMGTERGTSPTDADTDRDGVWDGEDQEPLYPYATELGLIGSDGALQPFAEAELGGIRTDISAGWSSDLLTFQIRTSRPANILFQLDANADGWFHGFDNLQVRIRNDGDSAGIGEYYLRDCSSWVDPPQDRKDILDPSESSFLSYRIRIASVPNLSGDVVRFSIPAHPEYGMRWEAGKTIGIRLGIQTEHDRWVWNELFERNDMMSVTLR